MRHPSVLTRRAAVVRMLAATVVAAASGWRLATAASGSRARTPSQSEGPFYPRTKPAHVSNDLVNTPRGTAAGDPLMLDGRVLDTSGAPLAGARVEIWQADHRGIYRHPRAPRHSRVDAAFPGYGETVTDARGRYDFLTIVPVPYTGRPPHIHVKVWVRAQEALTTQLYLKGHPANDRDGLLAMLGLGRRDALMLDPSPAMLDSGRRASRASFDLVL